MMGVFAASHGTKMTYVDCGLGRIVCAFGQERGKPAPVVRRQQRITQA